MKLEHDVEIHSDKTKVSIGTAVIIAAAVSACAVWAGRVEFKQASAADVASGHEKRITKSEEDLLGMKSDIKAIKCAVVKKPGEDCLQWRSR